MKIVLFILVIASSFFIRAQSTLIVSNTNDNGFGSLREAASIAVTGDTIRFLPSLISSASASIILTSGEIDFGNKGIIIKGLYNSSDTLYISGNNLSRIFNFSYPEKIVLDSVVLINGNEMIGGAVRCYRSSDTLFIKNSYFYDNTADYGGGAIYMFHYNAVQSLLKIDNSSFIGNQSLSLGGAICSTAETSYSSRVTISNSILSNNFASDRGGGIYNESFTSSFLIIDNSEISYNNTNYRGGGICSESSYVSSVQVSNSDILNNSAPYGGGVYSTNGNYSGNNSGNLIFTNATFSQNSASTSGGGLYSYSDSIFIINSVFSENDGGGIHSSKYLKVLNSNIIDNSSSTNGAGVSSTGAVDIVNSNLSGNTSMAVGGAISMNTSKPLAITNSTIENNTASTGGGVAVTNSSSANGSSANIYVLRSTIINNIANYNGGGVYVYYSTSAGFHTYSSNILIENSTIAYNTCSGTGGGVHGRSNYVQGSLNVINSTIYGNTASNGAGVSASNYCPINITSSVIAENGSGSSGILPVGGFNSNGNNILSDSIPGIISSDQINASALSINLQPLAFNGGLTQTMFPGTGSIAIDTGNPQDLTNAQNAPIAGIRDAGAAEGCLGSDSTIHVEQQNSYSLPSGNGTVFNSGIFSDTLLTFCGADSIITIHLTINGYIDSTVANGCDSFTWYQTGITYNSTGFYYDSLLTVNNSYDSVFVLNVTINANYTDTTTSTNCNSYTWSQTGLTYSSSGYFYDSLLTMNSGCDSVFVLDLTINPSYIDTINIVECDTYTWLQTGLTYSSSGYFYDSLLTINSGCDSIFVLNLTINPSYINTVNIVECDTYSWPQTGLTYSSSGFYYDSLLTINSGCDSVFVLDLTIINSSTGNNIISSCIPYTWIDGNTYATSNNSATYTITNAEGCDSVITLNLTIHTVVASVIQLNPTTLWAIANSVDYQWLDCNDNFNAIAGATDQSYIASSNGNYAVIITKNNCSDTSECFIIDEVGIIENDFGRQLVVYPNPSNGNFSIDMGKLFNTISVTITDLNGKALESYTFNNTQLLNLKMEAPTGKYLLTIRSSEHKAVIRIVKE